MNKTNQAKPRAFTLIELVVVLAVLAIPVGVLTPAFAQSKQNAARINCLNNLKRVGNAFRVFGGNHQDRYPMQVGSAVGGPLNQAQLIGPAGSIFTYQVFQVMSNELNSPKLVVCPADDRLIGYSFRNGNSVATPVVLYGNTNISYFVGRDAEELQPHLFLAGDRNFTRLTNSVPIVGGNTVNQTVQVGTNQATILNNFGWNDRVHVRSGNVALVDGSVQMLPNDRFAAVAAGTRDTGSGQSGQRVISPGGNVLLIP